MKSIYYQACFFILIALAPVFPAANLFAQSDPDAAMSSTDSSHRAIGIGVDHEELMRQLDADGDDYITQNEWDRVFTKYDANEDRRLSVEEMRAISRNTNKEETLGPDYGRMEAFDRLDKNRNDAIDISEWPGKEKGFQYLDSSRDGSISRKEFLSKNGRWWNVIFESLDFDDNKIIDRSEWLDSEASFNRLDRDHNGVIVRNEFYNPR
jgi:Ca2+-binding EF-hand superfamily protein